MSFSISGDLKFLELEISRFFNSRRRFDILSSQRYYLGYHDILSRRREVIGVDGSLDTVDNLPNNKIVDNQFKKLVNQKNNYLLGKPISFFSDSSDYSSLLKSVFNKDFNRLLKNVGEDSLVSGIGWLYVFYNSLGELSFRRFNPNEIIPGWADAEHSRLDYLIRVYNISSYHGSCSYFEKTSTFVELYEPSGIYFYTLENSRLIPCLPFHQNYFSSADGVGFNWDNIPVIPFKFNKESPLLNSVRSLQDGLNLIESNFLNHMQEDQRNTILVLVNYDGENLADFRKNLSTYGAVKVNTVDNAPGDVRSLQVEVNADNYNSIIKLFKSAIIENGMGYDAKDDRLSGSPNQMNIQSMYSDIDLDANSMETEFQASFQQLLSFVNLHFVNCNIGDFSSTFVDVIFNRDILINESEVIDMCSKSLDIISRDTVFANHPWVDDVLLELERAEL